MKILHQRHSSWLSNTYLVIDETAKTGAFIDAGGPTDTLEAEIDREGWKIPYVFLTHHHHDHVQAAGRLSSKYKAEIVAHPEEKSFLDTLHREMENEQTLSVGSLTFQALHIPGHTAGQLAFYVDDEIVFTGDTLFKGSIGGNLGPGHTTFEDLQSSIMNTLMKLPPETKVLPGHMDETTVETEWDQNRFIRAFRGLDPVQEEPCTVFGQDATLLLRAPDYDGGTKCWVRFPDGTEAIAPGSRVE